MESGRWAPVTMTGGRHRAYRTRGRRISNRQTVDTRSIVAVMLEDGGWYRVLNHSFSLCRLKLRHGTERSDIWGASFYFYGEPLGLAMSACAWIDGPVTSIRAVREGPDTDLIDNLLGPAGSAGNGATP
jgi:hypothetical protein